jgi:hypothetical protein
MIDTKDTTLDQTLTITQLVLIWLKVTGTINVSWLWILTPCWLPFVLIIVLFIVLFIGCSILSLFVE